jgi:hypothetical protein
VDKVALGSPDESGWPPIGEPHDDAAWQNAREQALSINHQFAHWIANLADAELEHPIAEAGAWNQRHQLIQGIIAHNSYHTCEIISIRHLNGWWFDAM